ncbi:hypothetical protein [Dictyobacter arantiisoli]|uniref:Uncharacterized protein n=1 Tax=Dictyobacter arantiisoli TaxID=2014874 RepID=A0A5A5TKH8_9CHLR|nr:hypothetical protein [Dictyobacter arantiisoli]GCF11738.1 hypothetical protein KDI_53020 [Dictyobacter arantiisoli]
MARLKLAPGAIKRALALSEWLYGLFLHAYPATFRRTYGSRMAHVFRDSCRDALQQHGWASLIPFWLKTLSDLVHNACLERWHLLKEGTRSMASTPNFPLRLWVSLTATVIAFAVSLLASINLYLIEDSSHLTQTAYAASPLLRFSYDGIYLSALAAGVGICAILGYAFVRREGLVVVGLIMVTLLIAFGGFGGLLVHHSATFLVLFAIFLALTLISLLCGRAVAIRAGRFLGQRSAAVLGACASVGSVLLVNVVALVLHTLSLNPVSHALYMQGQIGGTHLNFSLIAMSVALFTLIACTVSLGRALRFPSSQSSD